MANLDVEEFIQQNRAVADEVETYRGYWESEKHWQPRREFILRNINDFEEPHMDQLLALSMVWANNVFMGCRCVNTTCSTDAFVFENGILKITSNLICSHVRSPLAIWFNNHYIEDTTLHTWQQRGKKYSILYSIKSRSTSVKGYSVTT